MTKEELVTLRTRVSEARYVWVRILNGTTLEVRESPGGPETMNDGSVWLRFVLADDVRKAINSMADPS
jgi:hypothetical protein